jgi:fermentation-respiration switch protein FrsA (DUF1100 family)
MILGMPTFVLHGDDDQIVPIGAAALLSSKLVKGALLKVIPGAPHGMCSTLKDQINAELLAFLQRSQQASAQEVHTHSIAATASRATSDHWLHNWIVPKVRRGFV